MPAHPVAAAESLLRNRDRTMDVGVCGHQPFLMMASAGLDAKALAGVDPSLKRWLGTGAVAWSGLRLWLSYEFPEIDLCADGRTMSATFAAVCNVPQYGGRRHLAPSARPDDGRLDLVVFTGSGRSAACGFARDFVLGRHSARPDVEILQVEEVELRGPDELALQLDGDAVTAQYPLTVRLAPHRLRLLAPGGRSN